MKPVILSEIYPTMVLAKAGQERDVTRKRLYAITGRELGATADQPVVVCENLQYTTTYDFSGVKHVAIDEVLILPSPICTDNRITILVPSYEKLLARYVVLSLRPKTTYLNRAAAWVAGCEHGKNKGAASDNPFLQDATLMDAAMVWFNGFAHGSKTDQTSLHQMLHAALLASTESSIETVDPTNEMSIEQLATYPQNMETFSSDIAKLDQPSDVRAFLKGVDAMIALLKFKGII